jgi:hypothetical protein
MSSGQTYTVSEQSINTMASLFTVIKHYKLNICLKVALLHSTEPSESDFNVVYIQWLSSHCSVLQSFAETKRLLIFFIAFYRHNITFLCFYVRWSLKLSDINRYRNSSTIFSKIIQH